MPVSLLSLNFELPWRLFLWETLWLSALLAVTHCGTSCKESTCQCRRYKRHRFNTWVGKIPWRRKWQPTPVCLPGKFHGQMSLVGSWWATAHGATKSRTQLSVWEAHTVTALKPCWCDAKGQGKGRILESTDKSLSFNGPVSGLCNCILLFFRV